MILLFCETNHLNQNNSRPLNSLSHSPPRSFYFLSYLKVYPCLLSLEQTFSKTQLSLILVHAHQDSLPTVFYQVPAQYWQSRNTIMALCSLHRGMRSRLSLALLFQPRQSYSSYYLSEDHTRGYAPIRRRP